MKTIDLKILDGLRGLAAFYVMVGHARWLLWEGYSEGYLKHPETYNIVEKSLVYFFSFFKFGHEAVLLFFVLSGFVIHLRYSKKINLDSENTRFDWFDFIKRRAKRLYPPLLFALLITFIFDTIGSNAGFGIYSHSTNYFLINNNINHFLDFKTLIGNLLFLMNSYTSIFGSNGPLWSLKFEWWFYMIYPLFFYFTKRSWILATIIMVMLFFLSFFFVWPTWLFLLDDVFTAMLSWWLGCLLADIYTGRIKLGFAYTSPFVLLLLILPVIDINPGFSDLYWAIGFSGLISSLFLLKNENILVVLITKLKWLGDMSYTLYVIHFPILVFISGWLMSRNQQGFLPDHFGFVLLGITATMLLGYFSHFLVEKPFITRKSTIN